MEHISSAVFIRKISKDNALKNEINVSGYKLEDFDRASAQKLMEEGTSNLSKAKDDSERAVAQIQIDTADVVLKSIQ